MDETPIYFDMGRNSTYHWKGERSIQLVRTNGQKKRVTVCLTILSDGRKLAPFIIFKGKKPLTNPFSKTCVVESNENAWITETLMKIWIEKIWSKFKPLNLKKLLILDKCSSHKKQNIINLIKEDSYLEFVPSGCTSLVQPLDILINKPFKDNLRVLFEKWMNEVGIKDINKTKKGKLKAPSKILIMKWINEAWSNISSELVAKAFKCAGKFIFLSKNNIKVFLMILWEVKIT